VLWSGVPYPTLLPTLPTQHPQGLNHSPDKTYARSQVGISINPKPETRSLTVLWRKGSARALETHGDMGCELGFTKGRGGWHVPSLISPYSGRDRVDVACVKSLRDLTWGNVPRGSSFGYCNDLYYKGVFTATIHRLFSSGRGQSPLNDEIVWPHCCGNFRMRRFVSWY
jgi:hypothetical protein